MQGEGIAVPLGETNVFPSMVVRMIEVGEKNREIGCDVGKGGRILRRPSQQFRSRIDILDRTFVDRLSRSRGRGNCDLYVHANL